MNKMGAWVLAIVVALWLVVCSAQADGEPGVDPTATTDLWTAVAPSIAPRRVQVLNLMIRRHIERAGFDVPDLPVWGGTQADAWVQRLPESTIAYADYRGAVLAPDWVEFANTSWPPMIDTVRVLIHENLHQLSAVGNYGKWTPQQRAIEEGRVEAAARLLGDTFYARMWPRARYSPMMEAYPACVRVVQVTAARATDSKLATRSARSFMLWMVRADIADVTDLAYQHGLHDDLAECEAETNQN